MIEKYIYNGEGYDPYLIRSGWQVAKLNYAPGIGMDDIEKIDVHLHTDEVFILIAGRAVLIAAEKEEDKIIYEMVNMEKGIVYNIPKGVWHNIAMEKDAEIIIVEKSDTHLNDFEYFWLKDNQKEELYKLLKEIGACPRL